MSQSVTVRETTRAASLTPEPIVRLATGFMGAKHLFVASQVGLFRALADGPLSIPDLAGRLSVPERTCRILADAMVVCGLLGRQGPLYENEPISHAFLSGRGPVDLEPFLAFWDRISYPGWTMLEECVRTGRRAPLEIDDTLQDVFSRGVQAFTAGSAIALPRAYDFSGHARLLDLGGGTGSFLLAVLGAYPHLRGTLFETPEVVTVARARLANEADGRRIDVVAGDLFVDEIPSGHDVLLAANVVHLFEPPRNVELLTRARGSSEPGTRLLLVDFWTDATHTEPALAAMMAGEFLVVAEGDVYSEDEVRSWLGTTGWRFRERAELGGGGSLIVAEAV